MISLKDRGVKNVDVFVSDGMSGLSNAISEIYPKFLQQRCFVHLARNIYTKTRAKDRNVIISQFMSLSKAPTLLDATAKYQKFIEDWKSIYPSLKVWSEKTDNIFTFFKFKPELRHLIYTNNPIENVNKDIKRLVKKHIQFQRSIR